MSKFCPIANAVTNCTDNCKQCLEAEAKEGSQMTKYYHMIIQRKYDRTGETRREYISTRKGTAPQGWICVGVCGYHEKEEHK